MPNIPRRVAGASYVGPIHPEIPSKFALDVYVHLGRQIIVSDDVVRTRPRRCVRTPEAFIVHPEDLREIKAEHGDGQLAAHLITMFMREIVPWAQKGRSNA